MAAKGKTTRSELSEVLLLYTTRQDEPLLFTYEVEVTTFKKVDVTLSFEGSENFAITGHPGLVLRTSVRPFSRVTVGSLYMVNDDRRAGLSMGASWTTSQPSAQDSSTFIQKDLKAMKPVLKRAADSHFPQDEVDPADEGVRAICLKSQAKFVDLDFPPTIESLFKADTQLSEGERTGLHPQKRSTVVWKRPEAFLHPEYKIFEDGINPNDIRQGALGDCWLLCAIAALTEFPLLIEDLFETKEVNGAGCYRIRLCKNAWWQSVRVDDFFPCFPGAGAIYTRSNGNELWVMLLEKAYAKACGSYEAIKSGWAYEGMMDMTGAPCKTIRFDDSTVQPLIASGQLWRDLVGYDQQNYIMSASTPGEDCFTETGNRPGKDGSGLVAGHAYTLISARQSVKGHKLVKLRNPWGNLEWSGDWSDNSPLWTQQMQDEIEPLDAHDDGTFWMSFEDLLANFCNVNVCMVRREGYHPQPWREQRSRFHYDYDEDEMTPRNERVNVPVFELKVDAPGEFVLTVHQTDTRCKGAKPYIDVGVSVLRREVQGAGTVAGWV